MKKNLFFTLCFSLCPGAGQMYQGYMKRGISILILFATFTALFSTISIPLFAIPLPVIYIYSFFDTFNIRSNLGTDKSNKDKYIWEETELFNLQSSFNAPTIRKILGSVLIFIGIYILVSNMLPQILYTLNIRVIAKYIDKLSSYIAPIAIACLSIFFGIKLVSKK